MVLAINVIHNLEREGVVTALHEIIRVSRGKRYFIQVDSYHTVEQRKLFEDWVLTARFHDYPEGWLKVFGEAGYAGDWAWTVLAE